MKLKPSCKRSLRVPSAMCAIMLGPTLALAQGRPEIDEIIVTAQKREQNLNDVGITITAATAETLQAKGVTNIDQLAQVAPGFSVGQNYTGQQIFSLRGINFNTAQISASPTVSTYVDEAILPYSIMTGALLLDVERVEVLKGPQGTLFGQNATGGSINVIAAKPTEAFAGGVRTELNEFGQVFGESFVSGSLTDTLRARVAASTTQGGEWQRGYFLSDGDKGNEDKTAVRLLLDWTPTEKLTVGVNLNAYWDKGDMQFYQIGTIAPLIPAAAFPGTATYELPNDARDAEYTPGRNWGKDDRMYQGVLRLDYEISDRLSVTSLTNYSDFDEQRFVDGDGLAYDVLWYNPNGWIKSFSQELRLNGNGYDGKLNYIVGGNYQKDKILDANDLYLPGYSGTPYGTDFKTPSRLTNEYAGIFANVDFEVVDGVTLTVGARYTDAKETAKGCSTGNFLGTAVGNAVTGALRGINGLPPIPAINEGECLTFIDVSPAPGVAPTFLPGSVDLEQKEDNVSWRTGLNYKPNDNTLFYGLISRGYKSGVFPVSPADLVASSKLPVEQEELTAYELGTKLELVGRTLFVNLAAFYYDYKDKQFLTYEPYPVTGYNQVLANIPKSKAKGFETEVTAYPLSGLSLHAGVTYVKTEVGNFDTYNAQVQPINVKGNRFSYAPEWSGTADADYRFPIADALRLYVGASMIFSSKAFSDLGEDPITEIPSYETYDARLGVESDRGWTAGLFVRNLTDEDYWTSAFRTADIFARIAGRPRTFGATASYRF